MTVTKKSSKPFAGIVVAGNSTAEAVALYRGVAQGKDIKVVSPEDGSFNVATASSLDLSNPLTGNGTMVDSVDFPMESMSFSGEDDQATVDVEFSVCAGDNGCGKHIIAESGELLNFCPSCSAALPEELPEEVMQSLNSCEECEDEQGYQGVLAVASTKEEAVAQFAAMATSEITPVGYEAEGVSFSVNPDAAVNYDPVNRVEASAQENVQHLDLSSESSAGDAQVEAHHFVCSDEDGCGMHVVASSDQPVFCTECGGILLDPADVEELSALSNAEDNLEDDLEVTAGEDEDEDEDLDGVDDLDDLDDDLDDGTDEDEDLDEEDLESESADLSDELDDLEVIASDEEDDDEGDDSDDDLDDDLDDDSDDEIEDEEDEEDLESESSAIADMDINLFKAVASQHTELDPAKVFVVKCGSLDGQDSWCAFYGQMPVAMASISSASESVQKIFNTPTFGEATAASIRENGVEKGLAAMGFNHISPDIDLNVTVEKEIVAESNRKVEEAQEHFEAKAAEMNEKFGAALATAAMGINRGFFKGLSNPISNSLIASLSASGVANPEAIVQQAFASHSDSFMKDLLNKAADIFAQSPETQNELAEAVANANFVGTASVEDRVSALGTVTSPDQKELTSQSSNVDDTVRSKHRAVFQKYRR